MRSQRRKEQHRRGILCTRCVRPSSARGPPVGRLASRRWARSSWSAPWPMPSGRTETCLPADCGWHCSWCCRPSTSDWGYAHSRGLGAGPGVFGLWPRFFGAYWPPACCGSWLPGRWYLLEGRKRHRTDAVGRNHGRELESRAARVGGRARGMREVAKIEEHG